MDNYYNLILMGFIIALIGVSAFWAFNTVHRIAINKNFCADSLTAIAKLWRRAQFIPEDAKESESLYLYRDFVQKVEGSDCQFPITLKNGGVRVMTRKEYDAAFVQKPVHLFSGLLLLASLLVAGLSLWINLTITKLMWLGVGLALILPVEQLIMAFFLSRMVREKNIYRDAIFMALKENSVNFLSITKPFIVVDAYPDKFGKNAEPLYDAKGDLKPEVIEEIRGFIMKQKRNEVTAAFDAVNQQMSAETVKAEPVVLENPNVPVADDNANQTESSSPIVSDAVNKVGNVPGTNDGMEEQTLTQTERMENFNNFVDNMMINEIQRLEREAAERGEPFEFTDEEIMQVMSAQSENTKNWGTITGEFGTSADKQDVATTESVTDADKQDVTTAESVTENMHMPMTNDELLDFSTPIQDLAKAPIPDADTLIVEPDEDDFSLESIGLALDAEIAKRNAKK